MYGATVVTGGRNPPVTTLEEVPSKEALTGTDNDRPAKPSNRMRTMDASRSPERCGLIESARV